MRTAARINETVAQLRGHGESAGGRVRIEVSADGTISNLYLHEEVKQMPPHELGRAIRDAQRTAIASITQSIKEIQAELTDNPYVTTILSGTARDSAQPASTTTARATPPQRPVRGGMTDDELDDWHERFNADPLERRKQR